MCDRTTCPRHAERAGPGEVEKCPQCQALIKEHNERVFRAFAEQRVKLDDLREDAEDAILRSKGWGEMRDYRGPNVVAELRGEGFSDDMIAAMQADQDKLRGTDGRVSPSRVRDAMAPNAVSTARRQAVAGCLIGTGIGSVVFIALSVVFSNAWYLIGVPAAAVLTSCYLSYRASVLLERAGFGIELQDGTSRHLAPKD